MNRAESVHPHFTRVETTDPITGHTVSDPDNSPWWQEGDPDEGITIYFDSDASLQEYKAIPVSHPEQGLKKTLSNPEDAGIDEG